jgi:release factor glutamine methyltransferase
MLTDISVAGAVELAAQRLAQGGCDTPQLDAEVLLAHILKEERSRLYLQPRTKLDPKQLVTYNEFVSRREQREPVAYIVGHKAFFALDFVVNHFVLIPRPETEMLVETAVELATTKVNTSGRLAIADVGTGSGCIAVTLAKHVPSATVFAGDISHPAVKLARENAIRHGVLRSIYFLIGDLLAPFGRPLDLVVSNPPYIRQSELAAPYTTPEVHRYEPRLALNGGWSGLEILERLLVQAKERLKSSGSLLVEIGSDQGQAMVETARKYFPKATIGLKQDLAGLDRLLVVRNRG